MDTLNFLKAILPSSGVFFSAQRITVDKHPRGGYFTHVPFHELDAMVDHLIKVSNGGGTIYHACSSFNEVIYKTSDSGRQYVAGRTKDNAAAARSLWVDFDVKPGVPGAYNSKNEAMEDLRRLKREVKLPTPLVVDSGNGIHAYFLLEESVDRPTWENLASKLRSVMDFMGVKHDPSRTCDIASILRPPGTRNFKNPDNPKAVAVRVQGERIAADELDALLDAYTSENDVPIISSVKKSDLFAGFNSDIIVTPEYQKSFPLNIIKHCQQVKRFSEDGGVNEPTWYALLGLLKHCEDGEKYAHEWSSVHAEYDEGTTSDKLDQWDYGPSTCDRFRQVNPSGCEGCQAKCASPIQLGYAEPENVKHTPLEITADLIQRVKSDEVGPGSVFWPRGFGVSNGQITVARVQADDSVINVPLVEPPFWVVSEVRTEEGEFMLSLRAELRAGKYHDFDIPYASLSSPDTLRKALAANRVVCKSLTQQAGGDLVSLVREQALAMQKLRDETNTYRQMGWDNKFERFLLGTKLIHKDGVATVRAGGSIQSLTGAEGESDIMSLPMAVSGTIEQYRSLVEKIYGGSGKEAYQYVLGAAIGSYVSPMLKATFDEWHGIPLLVYSSDSGYGKTTVVSAGLNAVCKSNFSRATDATPNFFRKMLEVFGSMPVFLDEVSKQFTPEDLQSFLYSWPTGQSKGRLKSDGTLNVSTMKWNNMGFVTSNKSMLHALTSCEVNAEATQVRVMEIDLAEYVEKPTSENKEAVDELTSKVYGVAAATLFKSIIRGKDKLMEALRAEYYRIQRAMPEDHVSMVRYMVCHAASTVIGVKLGNKLGLWNFDAAAIREFAINHIKAQIRKVGEYRATPEDLFAAMMSDMVNKLLVTARYDTLDARRRITEEPLYPVNGQIIGRYAIGCGGSKNTSPDPGRLYISIHAINEWAKQHKHNGAMLRAQWASAGLIEMNRGAKNGEKTVYLNKGIESRPMPKTRSLEFVVSKVRGYMPEMDLRSIENDQSQDQSQTATG